MPVGEVILRDQMKFPRKWHVTNPTPILAKHPRIEINVDQGHEVLLDNEKVLSFFCNHDCVQARQFVSC